MQPLERAQLNYIRMQIISACDRRARKCSEINWYNQMQLWMRSATESQYLLNLFIESNRRRMILNNQYTSFGSHLRWNLGGATGKNGSTCCPRPTNARTHVCIRNSNSELRIVKPLANRSCVRKMRLAKPPSEVMGISGVRGTTAAVDITA
jgi:hypothetical protein